MAIEQGPEERRLIDYALTGSSSYLKFLEQEMLPLVEQNYRIDENSRAIQGASWGGLLVRHALIKNIEVPLFNQFISMDGSYFNDTAQYLTLEDEAFFDGAAIKGSIYLSGATRQGNRGVVENYKQSLVDRDIDGLTIYHQNFDVLHGQITTPSIRDAIFKLYPN